MFERFEKNLKAKYRPLWADYCRYLQLGQAHFVDNRAEPAVAEEQIRLLERAVRKDFVLKNTLLARLQKAFVAENLSLYLLLEPLQAWRLAAVDKRPCTEARFSETVMRLAAPAARMLMVLNNENPSTYLPMTSLLSAWYLAIALEQKQPLLQQAGKTRRFWLGKLHGHLKNAAVLLAVVKSARLKFLLATEINQQAIEADKLKNNKQRKLEVLDRIKIFLYSTYRFVTVRRRTTETKGI